ncbi:dynein light chain 4, axonemal isoform X1 [Microtus oregoni]|uniref:dynein light chain 4, axonemal isoform X1 n=1 Tax=Microtus oregoni TaxID=111838 RepID=UPI001BB282D5|nr:dynein light chain 4, axonemal isoform X1 [Microtus oregoni]
MGLPCWLLRHSCSLLDNPGGGALAAASAPAPAGAAPLGERHFLLLLSWQGLLPQPPEQRDCWAQRLLNVPPSPPEGTLGESWERQKGRKRRLTISGCRLSPWSGALQR